MKALVLGGTRFIGRYVVQALLDRGHKVSTLNRGLSPDNLPAHVERLHGDRDDEASGLAALSGRSWDACIDVCGYTPRQVRPSATALVDVVRRYVFISAVAVYGDPTERPVVEDQPRVIPAAEDVTEVVGLMYGRLKVTCENLVRELYGDRCALLRPQIVVGPGDRSQRYSYWIDRVARGGQMLAPGDGSDHLQVIDVRDLARFAVNVIENGLAGPFNLAGPRFTWSEFLRMLGAENVVWVPADIIQAAGVNEFELPLFRPERGPRSGLMDVSSQWAQQAGLSLTDPQTTLRDTQCADSTPDPDTDLLTREREEELIRLACIASTRAGTPR